MTEQAEEDDIELLPASPWIDAKVCEGCRRAARWAHKLQEKRVQQSTQRASQAGVRWRVIATSDCALVVVEIERGVRVQSVRVVRERVHSGKGWTQIVVTADDFLLECTQQKIETLGERMCVRVLNAGNVPLEKVYCLHPPSATERLASLVADPPYSLEENEMNLVFHADQPLHFFSSTKNARRRFARKFLRLDRNSDFLPIAMTLLPIRFVDVRS